MSSLRAALVLVAVAVLLTVLFWSPLWWGYGFIGGDLYSYFFPQKAFLADRLQAGEFPLWNNLTGFGYPVLGESQTGAAYPPYLVAYYLLDVNTAYNAQHLLHYVLCFVGVGLFGRRIGLGCCGSILAAMVFTYGWFPARSCLEWAIVTGAWLPLALWCVESFLQTRWWRYGIGLAGVLGMQLLAGHFHLAFMTQLIIVGYGLWRVSVGNTSADQATQSPSIIASPRLRLMLLTPLALSIVAGFLLAAVQLVPAWELKTRSSRATVGGEHDPSYGHLPPLYLSQMIAPWRWYNPRAIQGNELVRTVAELGAPWHWFGPEENQDVLLMQSRAGGLTSVATNKVEAHLYCGLIPLALAAWWLCIGSRQADRSRQIVAPRPGGKSKPVEAIACPTPLFSYRSEACFWAIAGLLAVIYATGWLLPIARYIPGFNFFRGPGRYGIITTLAVAILAGRGLAQLLLQRGSVGRVAIAVCVLWSTVGDLWLVSRMVFYAEMVSQPAITFRDQSPIRKLLQSQPQARLYVPGQNVGNLLGVSCLPVYLGIAPQQYSDRKFAGEGMPKSDDSSRPVPADIEFLRWLIQNGVTHILSFQPLEEGSWQATRVFEGTDPLLNRAWGRSEPLYVYQFRNSPGRVSVFVEGVPDSAEHATVTSQRAANRFTVETESEHAASLLARELNYPGWRLDIDGQPAPSSTHGTFRVAVLTAGKHTVHWAYRPFSVMFGLLITVVTLGLLAAIGHVRFWHPVWLNRFLDREQRRKQSSAR